VILQGVSDVSLPRRPADFSGFVRADNGRIVDAAGRPLLLRGMGIGTWMLPEGYMWKLSPGAESPRQIEALFADLVGADAAQRFWDGFYASFFNEDDVRRIAETGFDHIRLPINARLIQTPAGEPIEAGLALIDQTIDWCRTHRLWLLLDLHGAPGGQTGTNIDDSPNNQPELFMDPANRALTITLWQMLARRYRDEPVVMGYDLLNEPLPNAWQHTYRAELVALYKDLTAAVRVIDDRHLIMYEGSHWATNWEIFTEIWDPNSVLQFHRYWMAPDRASIAPYLAAREQLGLPIYMGEGGENNLEWLYAAHRLYEGHDIGWNFWPWKKIDTVTSPASIEPPDGWAEIAAYAAGGAKPSREAAERTLAELLEAMKLDNCVWREEVIRAVTAERPSVIPAWGFGARGRGQSYETHPLARANTGFRAPDEVDFVLPDQPDFHQTDGRQYHADERIRVRLQPGDWLEYEAGGLTPEAMIAVTDRDGRDAPVRIERSPRGFRVVALQVVELDRITIAPASP
jgi:endoglucanase